MLRGKVIQRARAEKKRGWGGQLFEKYAISRAFLPNLSAVAAFQAWWSAGRLHSRTVGVRAEGQGHSPCARCQSKAKSTTEYWFRHADVCAYSMPAAAGFLFDGKEGGTRCKMHDGVCFVGGAGRAFIVASNCAEPARKCKRPTLEDLGDLFCIQNVYKKTFKGLASCILCLSCLSAPRHVLAVFKRWR